MYLLQVGTAVGCCCLTQWFASGNTQKYKRTQQLFELPPSMQNIAIYGTVCKELGIAMR